jgi:hypothetical protein
MHLKAHPTVPTPLLSLGILLLRAAEEGRVSSLPSSPLSSLIFSCFLCFGLSHIPSREFCSPGLDPVVVDILLVLLGLWRLLFSFSLCFFLLVFLAEGYTGRLCWGAAFLVCLWRVFSGCAFFMSSLEPDLCYSTGSFMTHVSLW